MSMTAMSEASEGCDMRGRHKQSKLHSSLIVRRLSAQASGALKCPDITLAFPSRRSLMSRPYNGLLTVFGSP